MENKHREKRRDRVVTGDNVHGRPYLRQQGQSLLHVGQDLRLKAGPDFLQCINEPVILLGAASRGASARSAAAGRGLDAVSVADLDLRRGVAGGRAGVDIRRGLRSWPCLWPRQTHSEGYFLH